MSYELPTRDHIDAVCVESAAIEPRGKNRKRSPTLDFDVASQFERQIHNGKATEKMLRNYEEVVAQELGFENICVYELYRETMRTSHDVYRRPQHSKLWKQNQLWNNECNSVQSERDSRRVWFTNGFFLKKISLLQVRMIQNDPSLFVTSQWYDAEVFLADQNTRHEAVKLTPCKRFDLLACSSCNIKTGQITEYRVELYSVSGNYFYRQYIWYSDIEKLWSDIQVLPKMEARTSDTFRDCHVSRYDAPYHYETTSVSNFELVLRQDNWERATQERLNDSDREFLDKRAGNSYELSLEHTEFNDYYHEGLNTAFGID